jgi:transcription antitermination factor NusG
MFAWHVATTRPFSELIAERHLEQQRFQAFNPKCLDMRIVRGRRVTVEKPYIPGYIFINFDDTAENWQSINYTRGIISLIYASPEHPAVVKPDAMQILIDRCSGGQYITEHEIDQHIAKLVPIAATVRITSGPFDGLHGIVKWSHHHRVAVLMRFLGVVREIDISAKAVEVISPLPPRS